MPLFSLDEIEISENYKNVIDFLWKLYYYKLNKRKIHYLRIDNSYSVLVLWNIKKGSEVMLKRCLGPGDSQQAGPFAYQI